MNSLSDSFRLDNTPVPRIVDLSRVSLMPRAKDADVDNDPCYGPSHATRYIAEDSGTPADTIAHIITELEENRRSYCTYHGSEQKPAAGISMMSFPNCCMQNLDRIRALCDLKRPPSKHTTSAALIHWGWHGLKSIPIVNDLGEVTRSLITNVPQSADKKTLDAMQEMVLTNFKMSSGLSGSRFNVTIPSGIVNAISYTAQDLGMKSPGDLAVVCICLALYFQPETFDAHRDDLKQYVDRFLLQVRTRLNMAKAFRDYLTGSADLGENGNWWKINQKGYGNGNT